MKIRVIVELEAEPDEAKQYASIVEDVVNDCLADRHWLKSYKITRDTIRECFFCPICSSPTNITEKDKVFNLARLNEQSEFRKPDQPFNFRFRCTCKKCGSVIVEKIIKNVKIRRVE
jgi:hypothetical protein